MRSKKTESLTAADNGWVHVFLCTERMRHQSKKYVHSATPFAGVLCQSENAERIEQVAVAILGIVAADLGLTRIHIAGVRSDNGAAARKAASNMA
eukprot:12430222-Karenia_brevis.AAC.1